MEEQADRSADIALTRKSISFDIEVELDTHPHAPYVVQARRIDISIDELTLVARGTKRDAVYAALLPTIGVPFLKWRMTYKWKLKLGFRIRQLKAELLEL